MVLGQVEGGDQIFWIIQAGLSRGAATVRQWQAAVQAILSYKSHAGISIRYFS